MYAYDVTEEEKREKQKIRDKIRNAKRQEEDYKKKFRQRRREKIQQRIKLGICIQCGKEKPLPGKNRCRSCFERERAAHRRYDQKRSEKCIAERLCVKCRTKLPTSQKGHYCEKCKEKQRIYNKELKNSFIEHGICPRCKGSLPQGRKLCDKCVQKLNTLKPNGTKLKRANLRKRGLCLRCGKNPARPEHVVCEECTKKRHEYYIKEKERKNARKHDPDDTI